MITLDPDLPISRAMAFPNPREDPVTRTTLLSASPSPAEREVCCRTGEPKPVAGANAEALVARRKKAIKVRSMVVAQKEVSKPNEPIWYPKVMENDG